MDAKRKIKVLIVDDHMLVREVFKALIQALNNFEVVGETGDARRLISLCTNQQPDVILMNLHMPYMDGVTATKGIRKQFPNIEVVILSSSVTEPLLEEALKAGAIGYILKTGSVKDLADAIRAAYAKKSTLSPEVVDILVSTAMHSQSAPRIGENLTPREREILTLVVSGLTNRHIAEHLYITQSTVKHHLGNIFLKLGTHSRTKIIALAIEYDLTIKD